MAETDISILALALCEFDIDVGNTLSVRYPQFSLDGYDDEYLVNCCLPDGGHIHSEDWVYLVLSVKKSALNAITEKIKSSSNVTASASASNSSAGSTKKSKSAFKKKKDKDAEQETDAENNTSAGNQPISSNSTTSSSSTSNVTASTTEKEKANSNDSDVEKKQIIFGIAYFRNVADATVKRGAIQKSLLLLTTQPLLETYRPLMKQTLIREMREKMSKKDQKNLLKNVYETINNNGRALQLTLFGDNYPIQPVKLGVNEIEGASLVELINFFGVDSILLWYGLLLEKRIMFCGQPASAVGNACFAVSLLVSPLPGFIPITTPYVALTHMDPLKGKSFIAGSTNPLFETKSDWWDIMGSLAVGSVVDRTGIKISSFDREFMKNVMSGIQDNKGENWVRQQFYIHTLQFLMALEEDKMSKHHRKYFTNFKDTDIYKRYKAFFMENPQRRRDEKLGTLELFRKLEKSVAEPEEQTSIIAKTRLLYDLSNNLENLSAISEVVDADGVSFIASLLKDENSQMRKYSVTVLAQLSMSLKGQIAIMGDEVLPKVVDMLDDPMPNVVSAACYCLLKISTLFIGVHALVSRGLPAILLQLVSSNDRNLVVKHRAAATLLQIYRLAPFTPINRKEVRKLHGQLKTPDRAYRSTILQLLDNWHEELPAIQLEEKMTMQLHALAATRQGVPGSDEFPLPDSDTRATASSFLLSLLVKQPELVLELVEGGGVELILANEEIGEGSKQLCRDSYALLYTVTDSNFGRKKILRYRVVDRCLQRLSEYKSLQILFQVARFLEICAQHQDTRRVMIDNDGVDLLINFINHHTKPNSNSLLLSIPASGALRYLLLFEPSLSTIISQPKYISTFESLANIVDEYPESDKEVTFQVQQIACSILKMIDDSKYT